MNRAISQCLYLFVALSLLACGDSGVGGGASIDDNDAVTMDDATDASGEEDADDASADAAVDASDDTASVEDAAGEEDVVNTDTPVTDTGGSDATETDVVEDVGAVDTGADDAAEDAVSDAADTGADATDAADTSDGADATDATGTPDTSVECDYLDLSIVIVVCGTDYAYLREWTPVDAPARLCPTYYTLDAERFESLDAALDSRECDDSCAFAPSTSVSYLRCGRRSGYIVYRAADESCGELYEFPEGLYPSFEEYEQDHPCPE